MPNWVTNILKIEGPNSAQVMKSLVVKEDNEYRFDFNKIIPMPKELNIISGSLTDRAIEIYLSFLNPENKNLEQDNTDYDLFNKYKEIAKQSKNIRPYRDDLTKEQIEESVKYQLSVIDGVSNLEDFINYGKRAIENIEKYGFQDWYSWSIKNWGTKWNACHNIYDIESTPNEIIFDTAWGNVAELIAILSTKFPENEFKYEFAEEWIGSQVGSLTIKNGELIDGGIYEDHSKEAFELAFQVLGEDLAESFEFDHKKQTYVYKEHNSSNEEEM